MTGISGLFYTSHTRRSSVISLVAGREEVQMDIAAAVVSLEKLLMPFLLMSNQVKLGILISEKIYNIFSITHHFVAPTNIKCHVIVSKQCMSVCHFVRTMDMELEPKHDYGIKFCVQFKL